MANETEVTNLLVKANEALETVRAVHQEVKGDIIGLNDTMVKANVAVAANLQAVQDLKQQDAARAHEIKELEKRLARGMAGEGSQESAERSQNVQSYLKKGIAIPEDEQRAICRELAENHIFGKSEVALHADLLFKDLSVGSNTDGGFWLMPQRSNKIVTRIFETTPMRMLADIQTTSNDSLEFIVDDDESGYGWVGEVDTRPTTTTPKIGKQVIPVMEVYANPLATQKMLDDAGFDAESWLVKKLGDRFSRAENTAFVLGNSPKQPKGFNTYANAANADTYEYGKIGTAISTASNSIAADDLLTLQNLLKEGYQANAKWLMNRSTFGLVTTLKDLQDRYLFQNFLSLEGKPTMLLLGKEVVFGSDMPVVADAAKAIAYADWSQAYVIVDRYGIRVLRDPYSTKGSVEFYSTKRVGGDVSNFDAIKRLQCL